MFLVVVEVECNVEIWSWVLCFYSGGGKPGNVTRSKSPITDQCVLASYYSDSRFVSAGLSMILVLEQPLTALLCRSTSLHVTV